MLDLSNGNILIKFFFFKLRFKIYLDEKKSGIFTSWIYFIHELSYN